MSIKNAAYYIDSTDIHSAIFYDIKGNYMRSIKLKSSEYHKKDIQRLNCKLDPKYMNKILLFSIIIGFNLSGYTCLEYCDKNTNTLVNIRYKSDLPLTKNNLRKYSF